MIFKQNNMLSWFTHLPAVVQTASLLALSNTFMLFAWYGHLRYASNSNLFLVIVSSWGIAFFEYMIMVPANRIGFTAMSVAQLKILQEVVSLSVFVPFAYFFLKESLKMNYVYAAICMVFAVYFIFKE